MLLPESWLREFCDPELSTSALADVLTMAGIEVENIEILKPEFSNVVTAKIARIEAHPNADRLKICYVDAGPDEHGQLALIQVVCGASNAREGLIVPLARVGAKLPIQNSVIASAKLRGVDSFGMLCSAAELGLPAETSRGLLELDPGTQLGRDISEILGLCDNIFELKLTPNLGHALSVYGIAREVSALTGAPLKQKAKPEIQEYSKSGMIISASKDCFFKRLALRSIENVNAQISTPHWMKSRLERCGQKSVSILVDISNYVMFEIGSPNHIFDESKIDGDISIRWAKQDESIQLLNGKDVNLNEKFAVIGDDSKVLSLAGIMGGSSSATSDTTKNIVVEVAAWKPEVIAGRARQLGFSTDASHRFERGVDEQLVVHALNRVTELVIEHCGGLPGPVTEIVGSIDTVKPIRLRISRARKVLGLPSISQLQCLEILSSLSATFTVEDEDSILVTPPSWRNDLRIEEDFIAEIIKVVGFEKLPDSPPIAPTTFLPSTNKYRSLSDIKSRFVTLGYFESINFSFVEKKWEVEYCKNTRPIALLNPISENLTLMRSNLFLSLVGALKFNVARRVNRIKLFEVGRKFLFNDSKQASEFDVSGVDQPMMVGGLAYGAADPLQWGAKSQIIDFFDIKADLQSILSPIEFSLRASTHPALHPGRTAEILVQGRSVGIVGELHPKLKQDFEFSSAPIVFEIEAATCLEVGNVDFKAPSKYQSSWRDLSLVVPSSMEYSSLELLIREVSSASSIRDIVLFDIYRPSAGESAFLKGAFYISLRLELVCEESQITDEKIDSVITEVVGALKCKGVLLRGQEMNFQEN